MNLKTFLKVWPQHWLPQHFLSACMSKLTHCPNPLWKNAFIRCIIKMYGVNLAEAESQDLASYNNFNAFFTRALTAGVRPLCSGINEIASPADGVISQIGKINAWQLLQAKGHHYSLLALLGGDAKIARPFLDGSFATIYLSPKDYHRLHMPLAGELQEMLHIPGKLYSVNATTVEHVPDLFALNERVVTIFNTEVGPMALILVGAIFVNSIETVWHGVVTPPTLTDIRHWQYAGDDAITLAKGEEMGRFNMGSTIIVCFGKDAINWQAALQAGSAVKLGEQIADCL